MEKLTNLKILLGMTEQDDEKLNDKLMLIIDSVESRLTLRLGGISPPPAMDHIIVEVASARFNRIGSEGMSSHQVEGESINYNEDEFAAFEKEIGAFLEAERNARKGRVRFL